MSKEMNKTLMALWRRGLIDGADTSIAHADTNVAYIGFDVTAPSLHVGSLLPLMLAKNLIIGGYKVIVVLGGATTKVGDPSGRKRVREVISEETIQKNIDALLPTFRKILGDDVIILDNDKWLSKLNYMDFIMDIGSRVPAGALLNLRRTKLRLSEKNAPLSYLEMSYPLLQAYDFYHLNRKYQCTIQIGGDDQFGNMSIGTRVVRCLTKRRVYTLTCPLLVDTQGKKMGKTEKGAVWLDRKQTGEKEFWEFWRNTRDENVLWYLKFLTLIPIEEIEKHQGKTGAELNPLKELLADTLYEMIHPC